MAEISSQATRILSMLESEPCHLTADDILARLNGASTATVYRALDNLLSRGLIRRVHIDMHSAVYEAVRASHTHFVCTRCRRIYDIPVDLTGLAADAATLYGHQTLSSETTVYGLCQSCSDGSEQTTEGGNSNG